MSVPFSACLVYKAALGDESAYKRLVDVMEINFAHGAFTVGHCKCNPPCQEPTEEQIKALDARMMAELAIRKAAKKDQHASRRKSNT